jgi:diketogulonate reductase-like aldo/keto reductase
MEFKKLSNNIEIPVIGLGIWNIGGGDEADTTYDSGDISTIRTAIKLGITHIDTAETYALGHTEEFESFTGAF